MTSFTLQWAKHKPQRSPRNLGMHPVSLGVLACCPQTAVTCLCCCGEQAVEPAATAVTSQQRHQSSTALITAVQYPAQSRGSTMPLSVQSKPAKIELLLSSGLTSQGSALLSCCSHAFFYIIFLCRTFYSIPFLCQTQDNTCFCSNPLLIHKMQGQVENRSTDVTPAESSTHILLFVLIVSF